MFNVISRFCAGGGPVACAATGGWDVGGYDVLAHWRGTRETRLMMVESERAFELELAGLIVTALNLEDVSADGIDPEAPLFGEPMGLDSIDALELALAVSKRYGFELRSDDENNARIFASLRSLARHVRERRTT